MTQNLIPLFEEQDRPPNECLRFLYAFCFWVEEIVPRSCIGIGRVWEVALVVSAKALVLVFSLHGLLYVIAVGFASSLRPFKRFFFFFWVESNPSSSTSESNDSEDEDLFFSFLKSLLLTLDGVTLVSAANLTAAALATPWSSLFVSTAATAEFVEQDDRRPER
jgi:hypothetical protein